MVNQVNGALNSNGVESSISRSSREYVRPDGRPVNAPKFIKAKDLHDQGIQGMILEGIFEGAVPNAFNEDKNDFRFKTDDGTLVTVNGAGNLSARMSEVSVGDYCRVEYLGMYPIKKGKFKGKDAHSFDVLIAK